MPRFLIPTSEPRRLREYNDCNLPPGKEDGGRFGANDDPRCGSQGSSPFANRLSRLDAEQAGQQRFEFADPAEPPFKVVSQDTKQSDTKKTSYAQHDSIDGSDVYSDVPFFDLGMGASDIAQRLVKYLPEDTEVHISTDLQGGGEDAGPEPDSVRGEYERYQEDAMGEVSSAHYEESLQSAKDWLENEDARSEAVLEGIVRAHADDQAKRDAAYPEGVEKDTRPEMTPEVLAEVASNLLGQGRAYSEFIDARFGNNDFSDVYLKVLNADHVAEMLYGDFDWSHDRAMLAAVEQARTKLTEFRPMQDAAKDAAVETAGELLRADSEYVATGFYLSDRELSDWYSDNNLGDDLDYDNIKTFDDWYNDEYGHYPDDWEDMVGRGGNTGEIALEFKADSGTNIQRSFTRDEDGTLSVYHAYFRNSGPAGQGKDLMRGQMELYESLGVDTIKTTANISTGAYAWARYGFVAESPSSFALSVDTRLTYALSDIPEFEGVRAHIADLIASHEDDETLPWKIADLRVSGSPSLLTNIVEKKFTSANTRLADVRHMDTEEAMRWDSAVRQDAAKGVFNIGRALMVGLNWSARFDMQNEQQRERLMTYIGDWTRPAD